MDKKAFMDLASKLYDEMQNSSLFNEGRKESKEKILPYKMRQGTTQIQVCGLARHYNQPFHVIDTICESVGATSYAIKNNRFIGRDDAEMVIKVINKKHNNFND